MGSAAVIYWLAVCVIAGNTWSIVSGNISGEVTEAKAKRQLEVHVGSQCFRVRGVPTLRLQCPRTAEGKEQLIHVRHAFHGVPSVYTADSSQDRTQSIPVDDGTETEVQSSSSASSLSKSTCRYSASDCIQLSDLPPGHQCNGRTQCFVHVSNPYLVNCQKYAVYMQINYTCSPKSDSIDVCSNANLNVPSGYLLSPNYPEVPLTYPPVRQQCRCVLRSAGATDAKAVTSVRVRLLDVALTSSQLPVTDDGESDDSDSDNAEQRCQSNYLNVTGLERRCGDQSHVTDMGTDAVDAVRDEIVVEYQFDSGSRHNHLQRGFWLEFSGSKGGNVSVSCGKVWSRQIPEFVLPAEPLPPTPAPSQPRFSVQTAGSADGTLTAAVRQQQQQQQSMGEADVPGLATASASDLTTAVLQAELKEGLSQEQQSPRSRQEQIVGLLAPAAAKPSRPFHHRVQPIEHRIQAINVKDDQSLRNLAADAIASQTLKPLLIPSNLVIDDERKFLSSAIVGDGSVVFENRDFSRARQSLRYNIDEVQIVTGIAIGIIILVAICVVIILVFRRK